MFIGSTCLVEGSGWCLNRNGDDQNSGVIRLGSGNCLEMCRNYPGATGCEENLQRQICYVHTQDVALGRHNRNYHCWVFDNCGKLNLNFLHH